MAGLKREPRQPRQIRMERMSAKIQAGSLSTVGAMRKLVLPFHLIILQLLNSRLSCRLLSTAAQKVANRPRESPSSVPARCRSEFRWLLRSSRLVESVWRLPSRRTRGMLSTLADPDKLWTLRCDVREALIYYVQEKHPTHLVRTRVTVESLPENADVSSTRTSPGE